RVTLSDEGDRLLQALAVGLGSAGGVREDPTAAHLRERVLLEGKGLVLGGNAGITDQHGPIVSQLVTIHKSATSNVRRTYETSPHARRADRPGAPGYRFTNEGFWDGRRPARRGNGRPAAHGA